MKTKICWILFFIVLVTDQASKVVVRSVLVQGKPVPVIPDYFNFTLVYNPGAAFGMFSGLPDMWRRTVLVVVSLLALLVVFRFIMKDAKGDTISQLALSGILAGALGNIIDRLRFDAVVDFLDFYYGTYHWPAFNIADSAISVGVVVLVIRLLFEKKSPEDFEEESAQAKEAVS